MRQVHWRTRLLLGLALACSREHVALIQVTVSIPAECEELCWVKVFLWVPAVEQVLELEMYVAIELGDGNSYESLLRDKIRHEVNIKLRNN